MSANPARPSPQLPNMLVDSFMCAKHWQKWEGMFFHVHLKLTNHEKPRWPKPDFTDLSFFPSEGSRLSRTNGEIVQKKPHLLSSQLYYIVLSSDTMIRTMTLTVRQRMAIRDRNEYPSFPTKAALNVSRHPNSARDISVCLSFLIIQNRWTPTICLAYNDHL